MKRHDGAWLALGSLFLGVVVAGQGCSFNPFVIDPLDEPAVSNGNGGGGTGGSAVSAGSSGMAGAGGASSCDCPADGNDCTVDQCNSEGVCLHVPVARGTSCNLSGVCDENGVCQDCLNCTADTCPLRCPGIACDTNEQCSKQYVCDAEEKLCCDTACEGPCKVCNRVGSVGTCTNLPVGLQVEGCGNLNACDGNGECKALSGQLPLGALCGTGQGCTAGTECKFRSCRTANNGSCTDHVECKSNFCDPKTNKCAACSMTVACPDGSVCNTSDGTCKSWLGTPCDVLADCAAGLEGTICSNYLCAVGIGAACKTNAQCTTYNCVNGKCATCTKNSDCVAGTTCVTNANPAYAYCKIAHGEICAKPASCQSDTCSGFPPVCD